MTVLPPALQFGSYRFLLQAVDPIRLPPNAGSTLRGGFGAAFRRIACFQRNRTENDCEGCSVSHNCPYGYIFETRLPPGSEVLRSQRDVPHPFVLEPPEAPPPVYGPGAAIEFNAVLVGRALAYLPYFVLAFDNLGRTGLGRGRGRFRLVEVRAEHPLTGESASICREGRLLPCSTDLTATGADLEKLCEGRTPDRVTVRFLTPTRIVSEERVVGQLPFAVLLRAILRRLSSLSYFHCGQRWEADYSGMIEKANQVETVESDLRWVDWERYSSRQDARMKLGGVVGVTTYRGPVALFLPLLLAAGISHVGKACTFGNGKLEVEW